MSRLRLLAQLVRRVSSRPLDWSIPGRADILIAFADTADHISSYFPDKRVMVLDLESPRRNIWILLIALFGGSKSVDGYIRSWLRVSGAKLLVSAQDNFEPLWRIQAPGNTAVALIQNGLRTAEHNSMPPATSARRHSSVDYYFCFNSLAQPFLEQSVSATFVPIGSFRSNHERPRRGGNQRCLAYISTFRTDLDFDHVITTTRLGAVTYRDVVEDRMNTLQVVADFCCQFGYELRILGKDSSADREKEFYERRLAGVSFEFFPRHPGRFQYSMCDASQIVVSTGSTLGLESLSRGNRTAIFNRLPDIIGEPSQRFGWPQVLSGEGPFWSISCSSERITAVLTDLYQFTDDKWTETVTQYRDVLPIYDPGNTQFVKTLAVFGARSLSESLSK